MGGGCPSPGSWGWGGTAWTGQGLEVAVLIHQAGVDSRCRGGQRDCFPWHGDPERVLRRIGDGMGGGCGQKYSPGWLSGGSLRLLGLPQTVQ